MNDLYNSIICRYHEIAIKGNNRHMFEKCLVNNLYRLLNAIEELKISRIRGRIWMMKRGDLPFSANELHILHQQMPKAFGVESYSPAIICNPDLDVLKKVVKESSVALFDDAFSERAGGDVTFRIRAKRSDKSFPLNSKEIELELAEVIGSEFECDFLKVDLSNRADITVGCEVRKEMAFIFYQTFRAPGGLPVGSNASVLALISGGIDSPVACYMAMKRGCRIDFVTFDSAPYTPPEAVEKVENLVGMINEFQKPGRLYICNMASLQKLIRDACTPQYRTILYRRAMIRISERIAVSNKSLALLTGESVGQVASQTIVNLNTINSVAEMLVLRPLIGMDKNEVIEIARRIGTFEISKVQAPDSCTVFAPKSPSTSAPLKRIEFEESKIEDDYWRLLDEIILDAKIVKPNL